MTKERRRIQYQICEALKAAENVIPFNRAKTFPGIAKAMAEQWGGERKDGCENG